LRAERESGDRRIADRATQAFVAGDLEDTTDQSLAAVQRELLRVRKP
jgi:hypothetical protein